MNIKRTQKLPLFTDVNGNVALWQKPNLPIMSWAFFKVASHIGSNPRFKEGSANTSTVLLLVWAYLESTKGSNYFRRALGYSVLCIVVRNYLKSR